MEIWSHTLKKKKTLKNTGKMEKSGKFVIQKNRNHALDF